jgi:hypothetical protein
MLITLEGARLRLSDHWHKSAVRTGIRAFLRLKLGRRAADPALLQDVGYRCAPSTERARMRLALRLMGWRAVADIRVATHDFMYGVLTDNEAMIGPRSLMQGTNQLLRAVGRGDLLHRAGRMEHRRGGRTVAEVQPFFLAALKGRPTLTDGCGSAYATGTPRPGRPC